MNRKKDNRVISSSAEETYRIGAQFGQKLSAPCIVAFFGDLGAGKTTFIKGIAASRGLDEQEVCSPTFTYLNVYHGNPPIYHFDLYRIPTPQEFIAAGFEELWGDHVICCIEWSERISSLLPKNHYKVHMTTVGKNLREIYFG